MPGSQRHDFDVEQLHRCLKNSVRHGARAARLVEHVPEIIELLYPAATYPGVSQHNRAQKVEADIRRAVDEDIGGLAGEAVATVLCLPPGTVGRKLGDRRRIAAGYLGIDPETFRRDPHEGALLKDLAVEIHHRATAHAATTCP
jgi:hypothetical protein